MVKCGCFLHKEMVQYQKCFQRNLIVFELKEKKLFSIYIGRKFGKFSVFLFKNQKVRN